MELRDYLRVLRRRWMSILLLGILAGAAAWSLTAIQTPQYASSARLFVSTSQTDDNQLLQGGQFSAQRVKSYADLITSRELAKRVIADTRVEISAEDLANRVSAEAVIETVNLDITVIDANPHRAQFIAQSYAEQLRDLVRELETPSGTAEAPIKATIVDTASLPGSAVSPRVERNVALGIVIGLLLGVGLAVLRESLDTRIYSLEDVREFSSAPSLGAIPFDPDTAKVPLLTDIPPHAPRAESFRVLRTNLQFIDVDTTNKVFVVTSAVPEEGKTSTAINLALTLASAGTKTLLIEADLRRPTAAKRLGLDDGIGVTGVVVGRVGSGDATQVHLPSGLNFMASGAIPPNPAELLQSRAMLELLQRARSTYDVVLIDAPPLLPVTDAALIAAHADGALLVLSHGKVTKEQARLSLERLEQVGAHISGLVMNKVPARGKGYGYGYGYAAAEQTEGALLKKRNDRHAAPRRRS